MRHRGFGKTGKIYLTYEIFGSAEKMLYSVNTDKHRNVEEAEMELWRTLFGE